MELAPTENILETRQNLPDRLIFGSYPEVLSFALPKEKQQYLQELINTSRQVNSFFWRTYDQQEIDLIEEANEKLSAFETKWQEQKVKTPIAFANAYSRASFSAIHQNNYHSFIT